MPELNATGVIYKNDEKPVAKWSFMYRQPVVEEDLSMFLSDIKRKHGVVDRCKEISIEHFKIKASYKQLKTDHDWPKGRVFSIDSQEQFEIAVPLLTYKPEEYELIGKKIVKSSYIVTLLNGFLKG